MDKYEKPKFTLEILANEDVIFTSMFLGGQDGKEENDDLRKG